MSDTATSAASTAPKKAPPPVPPPSSHKPSTSAPAAPEPEQVEEEYYEEEEIPTEIQNGETLASQAVAPGRYRWFTVTVPGSEDDIIDMKVSRVVHSATANIYVNAPPSETFPTAESFDWNPTKGPLLGPPGVYRISVHGVPSFIEKDDQYLVDPNSNWSNFDLYVEYYALDAETKSTLKKMSDQYKRDKASSIWSQSYSQEVSGKYQQQQEDSEKELQERISKLSVKNEINLNDTPVVKSYDVGALIGCSNEFSFVKKAKEKASGKEVAIKVIDKAAAQETGLDATVLKQQVDVLAIAKHKNVAAFKEKIETDKILAIVTEFEEGGDLITHLAASSSYTEDHARKIVVQLLDALQFLHEKQIIHKSILPENIVFSKDGSIKLVGFGLSQVSKDDKEEGISGGDPAFQAPEIINRQGYGRVVDIWSAGCVAYLLLSGNYPFQDTNTMRLYSKIRQGNFEMPEAEWKTVSADAKDFVKSLLTVDASKRPSAKDALNHKWLKGSGGAALPHVTANIKKRQQ